MLQKLVCARIDDPACASLGEPVEPHHAKPGLSQRDVLLVYLKPNALELLLLRRKNGGAGARERIEDRGVPGCHKRLQDPPDQSGGKHRRVVLGYRTLLARSLDIAPDRYRVPGP